MSQVFDEAGLAHPVTVVEVGPCVVTQVRTDDKDGYSAVQLGFGLDKRLNRPERGHRQASGYMSRTLREVKAGRPSADRGSRSSGRPFSEGNWLMSIGVSKGKGFAAS
jgi:large subunit ribosomal protein L3